MRQLAAIILAALSMCSGVAFAGTVAPEPILPDTLRWGSPPNLPGLQAAWVVGAEQKPGHYMLRVKLASGARIPPHTHPDERITTVLAGTVHVGFDENFHEVGGVAVPAGGVYVTPANVPHYVWAKEGDVMYQESGMGPTGTSFIEAIKISQSYEMPSIRAQKAAIATMADHSLAVTGRQGMVLSVP